MPSRSPSRRSSPLSPRSRTSSNRSPSFAMHSSARRGRSPHTDVRRRRMLSRGASARSSDGSGRGRGSESRYPPRSVPSGGYPQGQYTGMQHSSPRRVAPVASKRHSYSPSLSMVASTSGLKRKYIPHPSSSSSSSSSPPRPQHRHMQLMKKKKLAVERMAAPREPPIPLSVRKQSRSKSPTRDKAHQSRASSLYNIRDEDGNFDGGPVSKRNTYSVGRTSGQSASVRSYTSSPRRNENPQKRFMAEPVVRYSGGEGGVDDGRPIFRGPEKTESVSYSDRELKQIKINICRKVPVDELHINRKIVNPEDVVVVRRPDGSLAAVGVQDDMYRMTSIRMDNGEIVEALCKVPSDTLDLREGFQNASINGCEGSRPIFERDELREMINTADDADGKYFERERRIRQDYHSGGEERQRVASRQLQPVEEQVVALVVDDDPTALAASSSHRSLRAQSHRSRSPLPTSSRTGDTRLESISPHPFPSVERQGRMGDSRQSYYNMSPSPPPRITSSYGSGHSRDYEQAGTSRKLPSMSSQSHQKEGLLSRPLYGFPSPPRRRGEDLRYELEYRHRDDTSYERGNRELRTDSDGGSSDLRMRINEKRTSEHRALSHYHTGEGTPVIHSKVVSDRVYGVDHRRGDGPHEQKQRGAGRGGGHHALVPTHHEIMESEDFQSRSSFHNKSSSSSIPSWDGNPEYVPKGRAYYEHDNRDEEWVRMGGGGGPRGGRGGRFPGGMGGRGRMFRGGYIPRGRGRGRGGGRGYFAGGGGPGRGYIRGGGIRRAVGRGAAGMGGSNSYARGKATSPSLWKHDMFENLSSDENRHTSTSDVKQ